MATILWFGNVITEDGFGRIGNELLKRLQQRGHQVGAAGVFTHHTPYGWPYQVWALAGHDWGAELQQIISLGVEGKPWDAVIACQDWPYLQACVFAPRADWSRSALLGITPTDGVPIYQEWLACVPRFDALFTISRFGVTAFGLHGAFDRYHQSVRLLLPGVDRAVFRPAPAEERTQLRQRAGISAEATVLGAWMANQGRKCWPEVFELFGRYRHQRDPTAQFIADCDTVSPAGWNLPVLAQQIADYRGLRPFADAIHYREQLMAKGLLALRDRMVLADIGCNLAFREGYGLPLAELQSCAVLTLAQDWCSGEELCGRERGLLCRAIEPGSFGTWGNALDKRPDIAHALELLVQAKEQPRWAAAIVERAQRLVRAETWDSACDTLHDALLEVLARRAAERAQAPAPSSKAPAAASEASATPQLPRRAALPVTVASFGQAGVPS